MLYSNLVLAATAFAGFAAAQNYTTSGPLNVTASEIPLVERLAWCRGQTNNCPLVCGGSADANECDPNNLSYNCVCSDASTPNITDFRDTLPSFLCSQWISNCVNSHPNDLSGITACRSVVCGTRNASALAANASSASASSSVVSTTMASTTAGAATATSAAATTSRTGGAVLGVGQSYGTTALSAILLGIFGLAL